MTIRYFCCQYEIFESGKASVMHPRDMQEFASYHHKNFENCKASTTKTKFTKTKFIINLQFTFKSQAWRKLENSEGATSAERNEAGPAGFHGDEAPEKFLKI